MSKPVTHLYIASTKVLAMLCTVVGRALLYEDAVTPRATSRSLKKRSRFWQKSYLISRCFKSSTRHGWYQSNEANRPTFHCTMRHVSYSNFHRSTSIVYGDKFHCRSVPSICVSGCCSKMLCFCIPWSNSVILSCSVFICHCALTQFALCFLKIARWKLHKRNYDIAHKRYVAWTWSF